MNDELILKPEFKFEAGKNKEYKIEIIWNSAIDAGIY